MTSPVPRLASEFRGSVLFKTNESLWIHLDVFYKGRVPALGGEGIVQPIRFLAPSERSCRSCQRYVLGLQALPQDRFLNSLPNLVRILHPSGPTSSVNDGGWR